MKRLFVAIKIEPHRELNGILTSLRTKLDHENIKWVDPRNLHLTLAFLGDVEDSKIQTISRVLSGACNRTGPFELVIEGAGVFKNYRDPRIIWLGVRENETLVGLANNIAGGLRSEGFMIEERDFKAHLTIGRIRSVSNTDKLKRALDVYNGKEFQRLDTREIILFESILQHRGPIYNTMERFPL